MSKLRVCYLILGKEPYFKEVSSPEEAKTIIDTIADYLSFAVDEDIIPDHCSVADLEEYDEELGEWFTWYDEDGNNLDEHFNYAE